MTLLQRYHEERRLTNERERLRLLAELRVTLTELIPGSVAFICGSLAHPGRFNKHSDIDIALETRHPAWHEWPLTSELMDRLGRPVDIILLDRCRFADNIRREAVRWTL